MSGRRERVAVFFNIRASGLANRDNFSRTDPFVRFSVAGGARADSIFVRDNLNPAWSDRVTLRLGGETRVRAEIWDYDWTWTGQGGGHDSCGWAEIDVSASRSGSTTYELRDGAPGSTLTLSFEAPGGADEAADETAASSSLASTQSDSPGVLVRREFRSMDAAEQKRIIDAFVASMQNEGGDGTSEYARIAQIHAEHCHHGQESFPVWHRGYLLEMEAALQAADRKLGGDGAIALPYWDWTSLSANEGLPASLRAAFGTMPAGLVAPSSAAHEELASAGFSGINSDRNIFRRIGSARASDQVAIALAQPMHWQHASTRWRGQFNGNSLEAPHNSIHVAVGFPMTSTRFAAFHPIFHMHHCMVDRLYESYLAAQGHAEVEAEFVAVQRQLEGRGEANRYSEPLAPFAHPKRGTPLLAADCFDTTALGYRYDSLAPAPPAQLRAQPLLAVFEGLHPLHLGLKSWLLHVFVANPAAADAATFGTAEWLAAVRAEGAAGDGSAAGGWFADERYAGCGSVFGGKSTDCMGCAERDPYNVLVDVAEAVRTAEQRAAATAAIGDADASAAVLVVLCEDERGRLFLLGDGTDGVPRPVLRGPVLSSQLGAPSDALEAAAEREALVAHLARFGYLPPHTAADGGPSDESIRQAVRALQEASGGLLVDGICGPKTKAALRNVRADDLPDIAQPDLATRAAGEIVWYFVGETPPNVPSTLLLRDVSDALNEWAEPTTLSFARTADRAAASLVIEWIDRSAHNPAAFGAEGGALAHATRDLIQLDSSELWAARGQQPGLHGRIGLSIFAVVLHEAGHALGLGHTTDASAVMSPYYNPEHTTLTQSDISRAVALYGARTAPDGVEDALLEQAVRLTSWAQAKYEHLRVTGPEPGVRLNQLARLLIETAPILTSRFTEQAVETFVQGFLADRTPQPHAATFELFLECHNAFVEHVSHAVDTAGPTAS